MSDGATVSPLTVTHWVAKDPTYVKASEKFSGDLPDHEKLAVKQGAQIKARLSADRKEYWIVSDGTIDGDALPPHLRLLYKPNWKIISTQPVDAEEPPVTPGAASASREERIRIRSYELWELDGRPDGRADDYWHRAASELGDAADGGKGAEEGAGLHVA